MAVGRICLYDSASRRQPKNPRRVEITWRKSMHPLRPPALVAAIALLTPVAHSAAADWKPVNQVEIVVPNSPGGGNDAVGRLLQKLLQDRRLIPTACDRVEQAGRRRQRGAELPDAENERPAYPGGRVDHPAIELHHRHAGAKLSRLHAAGDHDRRFHRLRGARRFADHLGQRSDRAAEKGSVDDLRRHHRHRRQQPHRLPAGGAFRRASTRAS